VPDITDIPDLGSGLISVAIRSAIIYIFLVVALRLGGKREVGQLTTPDLVVLLIVANAVQNAMVGQNDTILGGIVATVVVLVLARVVQYLSSRSERVEHALVGQARILVTDGVIDDRALAEEEIPPDELATALREHGIERLDQVHLAVLEVDGSISVISVDPAQATSGGPGPRTAGRLTRRSRRVGRRGRQAGSAGLAAPVPTDGRSEGDQVDGPPRGTNDAGGSSDSAGT
jgi:uncharacterized membrane protein YcaP (DUF421 family)